MNGRGYTDVLTSEFRVIRSHGACSAEGSMNRWYREPYTEIKMALILNELSSTPFLCNLKFSGCQKGLLFLCTAIGTAMSGGNK